MSVLRGNNGPRYKHIPTNRPIRDDHRRQADADHRRGDRRRRSLAAARQPTRWTKSIARWRRTWSSSSATSTLTQEQHLDFGRNFGELHIHPAAPHAPGHPELMIIHADKDSPRANGEGWHSDVSCDAEPPMGSILYIRKCPPRGGDTLFASMYAAYEALSDRMKALSGRHDRDP